jgi:hypothetical protein
MADDQIFISYAKEDREEALLLYERLVNEGFNPWIDKENLIPGQDWRSAIKKAIQASRLFVLCLSPRAVSKKGFIQREIQEALDQYYEYPKEVIYIIPVLFESCQVPNHLSHLHWADLSGEKGFDSLIHSLKSILGEPTPTDLHSRADAIYNSYLIRITVLDKSTKQPIVGAIVELNEINIQHSRRISRMKHLELFKIRPLKHLHSKTDRDGIVYFAMPDNYVIGPDIIYVVSATAHGYGVKHSKVKYGNTIHYIRFIKSTKGLVLYHEEVEGMTPDEDIRLSLPPKKFEESKAASLGRP